MNYLNYVKEDCVNGTGWRCVLWVSGCSNGCKGCFQPSSQNPKNGEVFTKELEDKIIEDLSLPHIAGLTLTGGDPLYKRNVRDIIKLCMRVKEETSKTIWLWTGLTLQEVGKDPLRSCILPYIDVLVDGKYDMNLPTSKPWRGSDNQVVHYLENGISIRQE